MITRKMERVDSEVNKALGDIIRFELNDPRIQNAFLTILKSEVTKDMKYCKTFVSVFPIEKGEEMIKVLTSCTPYIKKCLARKVLLRNIPDITFVLDRGAEHSEQIEKILKTIDIKTDDEEA